MSASEDTVQCIHEGVTTEVRARIVRCDGCSNFYIASDTWRIKDDWCRYERMVTGKATKESFDFCTVECLLQVVAPAYMEVFPARVDTAVKELQDIASELS